MALESTSDRTNTKVKHAMLNGRRCSSTSLSPSTPHSDCAPESSLLNDYNSTRFGSLRKHASFDDSFPRVHSVGRAGDGRSAKELQLDLINHPPDEKILGTSLEETCEKNLSVDLQFNGSQNDNIPSGIVVKKQLTEFPSTKLNIPGNSVIVSEINPICYLEPIPAPVVAAHKLRPYPPGLITVVKEGPLHESPSALLASVEKELESLQSLEHSTMAPDDEMHVNGISPRGVETKGCHCRLTLEERLHATAKGRLQLQHQIELADSKCARWEREAGEAAENVTVLRKKVSELEMELAARTASLHGLKAKVAEQYMENDDINEKRRQYERDCKAQLAQLDSLRKSEQWYREQLHLTQVERSAFQKQLMAAQEDGVRQAHDLEKLRSELKQVQDQLAESEEKAWKEKQRVTMQLEKALAFPLTAPAIEDVSKTKQLVDDHVATELKQRISDLELSSEANRSNLDRSRQEIDRLLSRSLQLQRELSETKIRLQEEQDRHMSVSKDREKTEAALKEREHTLALLSREHAELAVKLECQARERLEQDDALQTLTRNFTNVSSRFNAMRTETQEQRAVVEALREQVRSLQADRDVLQARLDEGARREQTNAVNARLHAGDRSARESHLEHEVLGLREAVENARGAQKRAEQLQTERDELSALNEQLRAQVDRLSQLLQQNTGSKVRDQQDGGAQLARMDQLRAENAQLQAQLHASATQVAQLQGQLKESAAQVEHLQENNGQLQAQVQRSASRLGELSHTMQELEAEMAQLRAQGEDGELLQLRTSNAQLLRDNHDLTARAEELAQWLDTITQGMHLGASLDARDRAGDKLSRLSATPVNVEDVEADPDHFQTLQVLQDANSELALYAASLQRRPGEARPDLLSTSQNGETKDATQADVGELRGLLALLQVCLYRVQAARRTRGHGDGHGDAADEEKSDDVLVGDDVQGLTARIRRGMEKLAASLEELPVDVPAKPVEAESNIEARLQSLEALEEEHRDLKEREDRREDLVRALLGRLKDQVLARKAAEQKLAALGQLSEHTCHSCGPNGPTPAAGDGLSGGEKEADGERDRLERELAQAHANIAELHKQLFNDRRDASQLRKEVASLRLGLETANDMLDSNKMALGRSESYAQLLKVSKDQLQARFEQEQRDHEDCRVRLEALQDQLQEARAKDPLLESQIKTLGCYLHQRSGEVRALQDKLALRDGECDDLRTKLERQRASARRECETLQLELQQAQREFAEALRKMSSNVPDPVPCDEEGLSALIEESERLSPAVLDDLKTLLHNLKAELKSVERGVGIACEKAGSVVQHV